MTRGLTLALIAALLLLAVSLFASALVIADAVNGFPTSVVAAVREQLAPLQDFRAAADHHAYRLGRLVRIAQDGYEGKNEVKR